MIKRISIILLILPVSAYASYMFIKGPTGGGGGTHTDYTADGNCVAAYFLNGTNSETDQSGNSQTLTMQNTVVQGTTLPSGYSGYSRTSDSAVLDRLYKSDGGTTDINGADQAISICAWIRPTDAGADRYFASKGTPASDISWLLYVSTSDQKIRGVISSDGSTKTYVIPATTVVEDSWYHVCMVYDDTDIRMYINGSLDSNGLDNPKAYTSGLYDSTSYFTLYGSGGSGYYGEIDEFIMLDRALNSAEVTEIYTYGIDGTKGAND